MGKFEVSYNQLNDDQRQAVDAIDGPVLVVAGPGTGKTQLLSMRVANILRQTDTDPSSILCLTFTNKAAVNMRERLIALTDGEARNVMVKTFHSFAAELMNLYPDYFWNGAKLRSAPDASQIEIIQDILSGLPLDNPLALKFAGTFTAGKDVMNALKHTKEAGLTPDQLEAIIKANLAYIDIVEPLLVEILSAPLSIKKLENLEQQIRDLPEQGISGKLAPLHDLGQVIKDAFAYAYLQDIDSGKTSHTGKCKQRFLQTVEGQKGMFKERERNAWWLALSGVYRQYRSILHSRGYYDYSDMIVEVITQLQNHASMRSDAQERFLYVLIDEFQDTNAAQLQLAHLISDHHSNNDNPNLMAVGDDDQSIYKFNGAELNNMLTFRSSYKNTKLIILEDNYRSSQEILDTSKTIIEQADDRLVKREPGVTKNLRAQNEPKELGEIVHYSYPTQEHELSAIAHSISEQYINQTATKQSMAVLARDHASLQQLSHLLVHLGVPVSYEKQSNILDHAALTQIQLIGSLLVAIKQGDASQSSTLLSQTLRSPMWGLQPRQLWDIAVSNRRGGSWLDYLLKSHDSSLSNIAEWLLWLSQLSEQEPLPVIIEHVIGLRAGTHLTSPLKEYFIGSDTKDFDYLQALSAIRLLIHLVDDFARGPVSKIEDLVAFIQLAKDTGEVIADESVFVTGDNAVELLTVHKAKGLEFDTVYIINVLDTNWKPSTGGRKAPANLPLQPVLDDSDDYARLMYVAATRAKRSLIVASYRTDVAGKDVLASPLVHDLPLVTVTKEQLESPVVVLEQNLSWPHLNSKDEKRNLSRQLDEFVLSASSYLSFLDLSSGGPEQFLESQLLSLPQAKTTNMAFGTAIHAALEYAQIAANTSSLSKEKVLEHYVTALGDQWLPTVDYERYIDHGKQLLSSLLESSTFWITKGGLPEQSLNDITIGAARVKGTIDRINIHDDTLTIIDYKTGKPLSSFITRDQTKAVKAWKHRTQLVFYAMLIKHSARFKPREIIGQMWYLQASAAKELIREYKPSPEEITRTEQLSEIIYTKVKELNLPIVTHYSADYLGIQLFEQDLLDGKI
jgi:DNA helicase II / ATP-dependent DNA helicase PcrA